MALVRTGFAPDRTATRRSGGVTGAVDRALPFPHHTAIDATTLQHGRVTVYTGALPTDAGAFADWHETGVYTLKIDHAATPGGAWAQALRSTDTFLAAHNSLDPTVHAQGAVGANYAVLEYDDQHAVLGSPGWTASAAAQAQLAAAGWTGVVGPVNIAAPARNAAGRLTLGTHKHVVTADLSSINSLKEAYATYLTAITGGAGNASIDGITVSVRPVGAAAPANLGHELVAWPGVAPATVGQSFDQMVGVFFGGAEISVVAMFDAGAPSPLSQAAGVNVRSTVARPPLTQTAATHQGIGWFVAPEWTDDAGMDGIDIDALWRSVTVTEFQIATAAERPIAAAAGAGASVDPFELALDSILGQFAYGTGHDASAEMWIYQHPPGAAPFVQPATRQSQMQGCSRLVLRLHPRKSCGRCWIVTCVTQAQSDWPSWGETILWAGVTLILAASLRRSHCHVSTSPKEQHSDGILLLTAGQVQAREQTPQAIASCALCIVIALDTQFAQEPQRCSQQVPIHPRASGQ